MQGRDLHTTWVKITRGKNTLLYVQGLAWDGRLEEKIDERASEPVRAIQIPARKLDFYRLYNIDYKDVICQGTVKSNYWVASAADKLLVSGRQEFGSTRKAVFRI